MPRCKRCKGEHTIDWPLFECTCCHSYYHSACHRPHPDESITNWVCKRCLAQDRGAKRPLRYRYNDSSSSAWSSQTSRSTSPSGTSLAATLDNRLHSAQPVAMMAATATAAASQPSTLSNGRANAPAPALSSSAPSPFLAQRNPFNNAAIISCSYPGCVRRIDGNSTPLCEDHLPKTVAENGQRRDSILSNFSSGTQGSPPPVGRTSTTSRSPPPASPNPKKLLLSEGRRPIMRRKTAGGWTPNFIHQQPTPSNSAPPSRPGSESQSTHAFSLPKALGLRPQVHSPPASPRSPDGEPSRKRQKIMSTPQRIAPEAMLSRDYEQKPSPSRMIQEPKSVARSVSPKASRRASAQSPGVDKAREAEVTQVPKQKAKEGLRIAPLTLASVKFLDSSQVPTSTSHSSGELELGVNESPLKQHDKLTSGPSLNEGIKGYWNEKVNSGADPLRSTSKLSVLLNGQGKKPLLERIGSTSSSSREVNDKSLDGLPQTLHFPFPEPHPSPGMIKFQPKGQTEPRTIDVELFDSLIYSQEGASSPPPGVKLRKIDQSSSSSCSQQPSSQTKTSTKRPLKTEDQDEPYYAPIDPRIHWPQRHSEDWLLAKKEEIARRPGRKANFGRAADSLRARLREQQEQAGNDAGRAWLNTLPEKIAANPAWVRALRWLEGLPPLLEGECFGEGEGKSAGAEGEKQPSARGGKGGKRGGMGRRRRRGSSSSRNGNGKGSGVVNGT